MFGRFCAEMFLPSRHQKLRMRPSHEQWLGPRAFAELVASAQGVAQDRIGYAALFFLDQLDRFKDGRVRWSIETEKLIKAEPQDIAKIDIQMRRAEAIDPKIEQREISQHPVKQFQRETAIGPGEFCLGQKLADNGIGKTRFCAPHGKRFQSGAAGGELSHRRVESYCGFTLGRPIE
jgi:hypothetical protein